MARSLRREGLTMEAAARQLGVSVKTVSRWVGGTTEPRLPACAGSATWRARSR